MNNREIREAAKKANIRLWQVADRLGVSEFTFSRKLRKEIGQPEKDQILTIIENLKTEQEGK